MDKRTNQTKWSYIKSNLQYMRGRGIRCTSFLSPRAKHSQMLWSGWYPSIFFLYIISSVHVQVLISELLMQAAKGKKSLHGQSVALWLANQYDWLTCTVIETFMTAAQTRHYSVYDRHHSLSILPHLATNRTFSRALSVSPLKSREKERKGERERKKEKRHGPR